MCHRALHVVGIFFVLPCIESYTKVDLRTVSFDVPPQEVSSSCALLVSIVLLLLVFVCLFVSLSLSLSLSLSVLMSFLVALIGE